MSTIYKHCPVCPYGRLDAGRHSDCSNGGPTSKFAFLELWEWATPTAEIFQWCKTQVEKDSDIYEAEIRSKVKALCPMTEEQIEILLSDRKCSEVNRLMEKQLRISVPSANPIYTQFAEVVFKKKGLLYMASGNYVWTNGPTFSTITGSDRPIRVHDRGETQEMYEALSV